MAERPEPFHWNAAIGQADDYGNERAIVIGLSVISMQLDRIIRRLEQDTPSQDDPNEILVPVRFAADGVWLRLGDKLVHYRETGM